MHVKDVVGGEFPDRIGRIGCRDNRRERGESLESGPDGAGRHIYPKGSSEAMDRRRRTNQRWPNHARSSIPGNQDTMTPMAPVRIGTLSGDSRGMGGRFSCRSLLRASREIGDMFVSNSEGSGAMWVTVGVDMGIIDCLLSVLRRVSEGIDGSGSSRGSGL
uniref:Uncharacterized protein n=1 Tax=Candidatus Kentrum sp. MB TaxID=2138164 RepID=A0A451BFH0_9GAMM|nr:MAG: hypothetical protein BECKMB1821I_GA0114274_10874 [Candidatus Kentron sp. MB]VFK77002.1 MAG: hypothetical protein BECKMB1821H_GA0114242_10894 [Candidatus Kentron sp. MB]